MKAGIEAARRGSAIRVVLQRIAASGCGKIRYCRLIFESARAPFADQMPARLQEIGLVKRTEQGAVSVPCESLEILVLLAQAVSAA